MLFCAGWLRDAQHKGYTSVEQPRCGVTGNMSSTVGLGRVADLECVRRRRDGDCCAVWLRSCITWQVHDKAACWCHVWHATWLGCAGPCSVVRMGKA